MKIVLISEANLVLASELLFSVLPLNTWQEAAWGRVGFRSRFQRTVQRAWQQDSSGLCSEECKQQGALCPQSGRRETLLLSVFSQLPSWSFFTQCESQFRMTSPTFRVGLLCHTSLETHPQIPPRGRIPKPVVLTMEISRHQATPRTLLTITTAILVLQAPSCSNSVCRALTWGSYAMGRM